MAVGEQQWVRRCKRSSDFLNSVSSAKANNHGCSKNVWLAMDRASKCPQLNGLGNSVPIAEASIQPRLYGRSGIYSANCEYMVIVVKRKGCILLDTDSIQFKCRNNSIFHNGHEVSSFVCAESVY
ncbi:unnamed protein product [Caenorhabditis sp. 36 PRJEB53466]|nr:unnamed protein product [Caenorhabditis sp. 36 PRJEB53466]